MLDIKRVLAAKPKAPDGARPKRLFTPWGERIMAGEASSASHPRPFFERARWYSLDGWWECSFVTAADASRAWRTAQVPAAFDRRIRVPFSPEAPLSGLERQLAPCELLWYRRVFSVPDLAEEEHCILHFEAVDYACRCFVNDVCVGEHVGAYLPFSFDVTEALHQGENELALCVFDPSDTGSQLRGKQRLARGGIWYTAQSGIWQTVWLEIVPAAHIVSLAIRTLPDVGRLDLVCEIAGTGTLVARLLDGETEVVCASTQVTGAAVELSLALAHPHLWNMDDPYLYRLELAFGDDIVHSYAAFRSVTMERDRTGALRLCLNHEPVFIRGLLDQGYWSDGLMTPPADEALVFDIELARSLGFNLLRKHLKCECERWYYHCDRLGMLVMQDMPSGGTPPYSAWHTSYKPTLFRCAQTRFADGGERARKSLSSDDAAYRAEWETSCAGMVEHLSCHPSIVSWCLFNEGWGQFDASSACARVRALDPTRVVDAVSGWYDQRCGDFFSVHNYFRPLEVYRDPVRPARAFLLSEFGGLSCRVPDHAAFDASYGYEQTDSQEAFADELKGLLARADALERDGAAGFVYTQLSDVEEELNGLVTYDRRVVKA